MRSITGGGDDSLESEIVRLGASRGEDDLVGLAAQERGDLPTRPSDGRARLQRGPMLRGRVSEGITQKEGHGLADRRASDTEGDINSRSEGNLSPGP